jgi:hypothetical protein
MNSPNSFAKFLETLPKTIYFWLPVMSLLLGYGFFGRFLRAIALDGANSTILFLLWALGLGGVWALSMDGGLLATVLALGLVFKLGGIGSGFIAVAAATCTIWLGFLQTDRERSQAQNLTLSEIGAVIVILSLVVFMTLATYQALTGEVAAVISGAIAGSYTVIGAQIKASGLTNRQALQFFASIATLGLAIGWVYGWFTYQVFVPS